MTPTTARWGAILVIVLGTLCTFVGVLLTAPSCDSATGDGTPAPTGSRPASSPVAPPSFPTKPSPVPGQATPAAPPTLAPVGAGVQVSGSCGSASLPAGLAAVGVCVTAGVVVALLSAGRSSAPAAPVAVAAPTAPKQTEDPTTAKQRQLLADALVELQPDVAEGLAFQIGQALRAAGLVQIKPEPGAPFDPTLHSALGAQETEDPALVNRVASTLRPGYVDGQRVVTFAQVVVYAAAPTASLP